MSACIVDASIFGPLFFDDETDDLFGGLVQLLEAGNCHAPQHWQLELTNQILMGMRRKRLDSEMADIAIQEIGEFPVEIDNETGRRHADTYALAARHGLTIYDAAYLELALRRRCSLATYDCALRTAALAEGLKVLPTP